MAAKATKTWKHPTLGEFAVSDNGWSTTVTVPAFKKFSYDTGYGNVRRPTGKCSVSLMTFRTSSERPATPPPAMVALAEKLVTDPERLVTMVTTALWEDFNGRGPSSGMWWHGDVESIDRNYRQMKLPSPKEPDDLFSVLQLTGVTVFDEWWDHPAAIGYLDFLAAFEEEHGVSILTRGDEVLGTGYSDGSVMLWEHLRQTPPPRNPFV